MSRTKILNAVSVFFLAMLATGCPDPQKKADEVFKKYGLNRLRVLNDAIQPGSVILVKDGRAVYADNMLDYNNGESATISIQENNSVISNTEANSTMDAGTALKFLSSLIPVSIDGKIKLSSGVKLDQIYAKTRRIKTPELLNYLGTPRSQTFKDQMLTYIKDGHSVFIAYETQLASKLKLKAVGSSDISVGAEIGAINPIIEAGKPTFSWKKNSSIELQIEGDNYYVFAVRAAKLSFRDNRWRLEITNLPKPGVLATDDQYKYSYSPIGTSPTDFQVLDLEVKKP